MGLHPTSASNIGTLNTVLLLFFHILAPQHDELCNAVYKSYIFIWG